MNPYHDLLHKLFTCLDTHDHQGMASCYHGEAKFKDMAFSLHGKKHIQAMWHMLIEERSDLRATFKIVQADEKSGNVERVDSYSYYETGRKVRSIIRSTFKFRDGLIIEQEDSSSMFRWATQAVGLFWSLLLMLDSDKLPKSARYRLEEFMKKHSTYA